MDAVIQELRLAVRRLFARPGFTVVTVLTLAIGIGSATALLSVVNDVLLRPLPFPEPANIMRLWELGEGDDVMHWGAPNFIDIKEQSESFAAMAAYTSRDMTVIGNGDAKRVNGTYVSTGFFAVLDTRPISGRVFLEEEVRNTQHVVILSYDFWQREFGTNVEAIGKTLSIDNEPYVIVGVMAEHMAFPALSEFWIPTSPSPSASRTAHNWNVIGRLANGVTIEQARQELGILAKRLSNQYGNDIDMVDVYVTPQHEFMVRNVRTALLILFAAATCLLLIACANVTNLLLARATSSARELSIRLAVGASRYRLMGRFLAEAFILSIAGAVVGVLLTAWITGLLLEAAPKYLPRLDEVGVDGVVLAFALGISIVIALGIGLVTAWRATGASMQGTLAGSQKSQTDGAGGKRTRNILVITQIALTLVLLTGVGLLGRSFIQLLNVDPGYRTSDAVVMDVLMPAPRGAEAGARIQSFYQELISRLRSIPGVEQVGGINAFPLTGFGAGGTFLVLNQADEVTNWEQWDQVMAIAARTGHAQYRVASRGYFRTMEVPLLRGRLFNKGDTSDTSHVAVISQSLAQQKWPNENPLGKLIQFGNMDGDLAHPFTIVGVVGDIRGQNLNTDPRSMFYVCTCQRTASLGGRFTIAIHGSVANTTIIAAARRISNQLAPGVPVRFRTLSQVFSDSLTDTRFTMALLGVFGIAALLLAAMGIYGVIAYLVAQQTREFGIRLALGAQTGNVLRLVLRRGAMLTLVGLAAGLVIALAATRVLSSMLFGVSATDPIVFVGVIVLLASVALFACYIPAHRATKVDPMTALREE